MVPAVTGKLLFLMHYALLMYCICAAPAAQIFCLRRGGQILRKMPKNLKWVLQSEYGIHNDAVWIDSKPISLAAGRIVSYNRPSYCTVEGRPPDKRANMPLHKHSTTSQKAWPAEQLALLFIRPQKVKVKIKWENVIFLIKKSLKFTGYRLTIGVYSMNERNGRIIWQEDMIERMPREEYYLYA